MDVFRYGKFYTYDTTYSDSSWSREQIYKAASMYATCRYLGYDEQLSNTLSYMFIQCESVPETVYEKKYMELLKSVMDRVERA